MPARSRPLADTAARLHALRGARPSDSRVAFPIARPPAPAVAVLAASLIAALAVSLSAIPAAADYATPGTGVDWTLDDIVANSGGAVTGGDGTYQVHASIIVSVTDRLTVAPGTSVVFQDQSGTIGLEVNGTFEAIGTGVAPIVFDAAVATPGAWRGLDYTDSQPGSAFHLDHCEIAHADIAVDDFGGEILVENCDIHDCLDRALDFTEAGGIVRNCRLHDNRQRTVVMTLSSSPVIEGCWMENNNIENSSPYPYINIGLQGVNSPTIRDNVILGSGHEMSGGIALWNASAALIDGNHIEGCGYGILCYQTGANPWIRNNTLVANNIHPDTLNWGFGVACNGSNAPVLSGNLIRGHGYGVAAINGGRPNLGNLENGDPDDDGGNAISGNGLDGEIYGFYNNTPLAQTAQGNWWGGATQQEVEDAIWHQADDPALGPVDYSSWLTANAIGDPEGDGGNGDGGREPGWGARSKSLISDLRIAPSPFRSDTELAFRLSRPGPVSVDILDVNGRMVKGLHTGPLGAGDHSFRWDGSGSSGRPAAVGVYYARVLAGGEAVTGKLVRLR